MLKSNELQILSLLFDDFSVKYTIHSIAKKLGQKYSQTFKIVKQLESKNLIKLEKIGNSNLLLLDWSKVHSEYIITEISRSKTFSKEIEKIRLTLSNFDEEILLILFGSYANNTQNKNSDIDLLLICENKSLEKVIKNKLFLDKIDMNCVNKEEFFEMINSNGINIVQELFKKHKIIYGYERFIKLLYIYHNR